MSTIYDKILDEEKEIREKFKTQEDYLSEMLEENTEMLNEYKEPLNNVIKQLKKDMKNFEEKNVKLAQQYINKRHSKDNFEKQENILRARLEQAKNCMQELKDKFGHEVNEITASISHIEDLFDDHDLRPHLVELRTQIVQLQNKMNE